MTNLEKLEQCLFEVGKVLPPLAAAFTTRVVAFRKDGRPPEHRGTALLCAFGAQQAFITANHVLTEVEREDLFSGVGVSCVPVSFESDFHRFTDLDVAVILPRGQVDVSEGKSFWPAEKADRTRDALAADYVLVQGFPARFSRYSALLPGQHSESYSHCSWVRPRVSESTLPVWAARGGVEGYPPVPDGLLRPGQFAVNYAERTGPLKTPEGEVEARKSVLDHYAGLYADGPAFSGQPAPGAFGLSGSPVWRFGAYEAGWSFTDWSPERARLAGIVTDWNEGHSILVATPMHAVVARLVEACALRLAARGRAGGDPSD